jgi:hypothetical protein
MFAGEGGLAKPKLRRPSFAAAGRTPSKAPNDQFAACFISEFRWQAFCSEDGKKRGCTWKSLELFQV